ncbi:hypothetical protein ACERIT_06580 [Halopenitus sp. H-Gu1]|uniref:hypothetical protein n=1 Tax=Halopenitus sp. H-Gu1 TaxID=3242697 RepID=UPI00359E2D0F
MDSPDLYAHYKATDVDIPAGVYRVVGRGEASVTLLRVGEPDERRVHTGELVTVDLETIDNLRPCENPDGNRPIGEAIKSKFEAGYWSLRVFIQQLAANLLPTTIALLLILGGKFGDQLISLPDVVFGGFILVGSLGLAYIGSGRWEI